MGLGSELVFNLRKGTIKHKGNCLLPLKSRSHLSSLFEKYSMEIENIFSIRYRMDFSGMDEVVRSTTEEYYWKLTAHPSIKDFIIRQTSAKNIMEGGLDLPTEISGTSMYTIFSLFRYALECPSMVMLVMEYDKIMEFDKALYLAHYVYDSQLEDKYMIHIPKLLQDYPSRPENHSVLDPSNVYENGSDFMGRTLPDLTNISSYNSTLGYGDIQSTMKIHNGRLIKDFPCTCHGIKEPLELAKVI